MICQYQTLALAALRPDHLTLSPPILDKLAAEPAAEVPARKVKSAEVSSEGACIVRNKTVDITLASCIVLQTDWLVNNGQALKTAIEQDMEAARKLADALNIFDGMEQKTKALIREELSF